LQWRAALPASLESGLETELVCSLVQPMIWMKRGAKWSVRVLSKARLGVPGKSRWPGPFCVHMRVVPCGVPGRHDAADELDQSIGFCAASSDLVAASAPMITMARAGYVTKTDRAGGQHVQIEVVTEGILLRRLQRDRNLHGIGVVLLDEFHERSMLVCCYP
jgi:hypothetical protein